MLSFSKVLLKASRIAFLLSLFITFHPPAYAGEKSGGDKDKAASSSGWWSSWSGRATLAASLLAVVPAAIAARMGLAATPVSVESVETQTDPVEPLAPDRGNGQGRAADNARARRLAAERDDARQQIRCLEESLQSIRTREERTDQECEELRSRLTEQEAQVATLQSQVVDLEARWLAAAEEVARSRLESLESQDKCAALEDCVAGLAGGVRDSSRELSQLRRAAELNEALAKRDQARLQLLECEPTQRRRTRAAQPSERRPSGKFARGYGSQGRGASTAPAGGSGGPAGAPVGVAALCRSSWVSGSPSIPAVLASASCRSRMLPPRLGGVRGDETPVPTRAAPACVGTVVPSTVTSPEAHVLSAPTYYQRLMASRAAAAALAVAPQGAPVGLSSDEVGANSHQVDSEVECGRPSGHPVDARVSCADLFRSSAEGVACSSWSPPEGTAAVHRVAAECLDLEARKPGYGNTDDEDLKRTMSCESEAAGAAARAVALRALSSNPTSPSLPGTAPAPSGANLPDPDDDDLSK